MEALDRCPSPLPLELCPALQLSTHTDDEAEDLPMPKLEKQAAIKTRTIPPRNATQTFKGYAPSGTSVPCPADTAQRNDPGELTQQYHKQECRMASTYKKKTVSKPFIPNRDSIATTKTSKPFIPKRQHEVKAQPTLAEIAPAPSHHIDLDRTYTLCVRNLPGDVSNDEIRSHFRRTGRMDSVKAVRVSRDREDLLKCIAFVQFKDMISFRVAIRMNGTTLRHNTISVTRSHENRKRMSTTTLSKHEPKDRPR